MNSSDWKKFTAFQSKPNYTTFPALPECITTVRLILGLLYGINLAYFSQHGGVGVIFGLNVITFVPIIYVNSWLNADVDSYKSLNFAGVTNSFALMLLVWIYFFTLNHEEEENMFAASVVKKVVEEVVGSEEVGVEEEFGEEADVAAATGGGMDDASMPAAEEVAPDKEF